MRIHISAIRRLHTVLKASKGERIKFKSQLIYMAKKGERDDLLLSYAGDFILTSVKEKYGEELSGAIMYSLKTEDPKTDLDAMQSAHTVLGHAMGFENNKPRSVLHYSELFLDLVDQALQEANSITKIRETSRYMKPLQQVVKLVEDGIIEKTWKPFSVFVNNDKSMEMLDTSADLAEIHNLKSTRISENDLEDILKQTEVLLSTVNEADIDDDIRSFLTSRLEEITIAIRRYDIGGQAHLTKVVEANVGAILLKTTTLKSRKPQNVKLFQAALELILVVGGLLDFGANVEGYALPKANEVIERLLPQSEATLTVESEDEF